jgi:hypothetical protein
MRNIVCRLLINPQLFDVLEDFQDSVDNPSRLPIWNRQAGLFFRFVQPVMSHFGHVNIGS